MQASADPVEQAETVKKPRKSIVNVLPLALVRARESVMMPFRNLLRRYDLTEPQFRVLRTVAELAEIELTELSRVTALPLCMATPMWARLSDGMSLTPSPIMAV